METAYLQEYRLVADRGSFTAAAADLHVTQSALSKHVAALEREYGVALFARDRTGVKMTAAGKVLYAQAAKLDRVLEQTQQLLRAASEGNAERPAVVPAADARRNPALRCKCRACMGRFGLTDREAGALALYLEECGIEVIGRQLDASRDEAAALLGSAYRKLGVSGKQEALDLIHSISE